MAVELHRRLFTVKEYENMIEAGILTKYDHVELVEGEIVHMATKSSRHSASVTRTLILGMEAQESQ